MTLSPDTVQLLQATAPFTTPLAILLASWVASRLITLAQVHLGMKFTAAQVQTLHDAAATAAGNAMTLLSRGVITPADIHVTSLPIMRLAGQARAAVPNAADHVGVTLPDLAHIIVGRVGAMISADPTIPTLPPPLTQETSTHA